MGRLYYYGGAMPIGGPQDGETADRANHVFYALWYILKKLSDALERIAEDSRTVEISSRRSKKTDN